MLFNKLLPLRHMTQLWNTYIRPHFQYVSPVLYTQSDASQIEWEKLRRWSLKLTLGLPKTLSSKLIDKIWELFDFQTPLINRLKQIQGLTSCSCPGLRWSFDHLQSHDIYLYNDYQVLDQQIRQSFEGGVPTDADYQNNVCNRVKQLNMELMKVIQKRVQWENQKK